MNFAIDLTDAEAITLAVVFRMGVQDIERRMLLTKARAPVSAWVPSEDFARDARELHKRIRSRLAQTHGNAGPRLVGAFDNLNTARSQSANGRQTVPPARGR